MNEHCVYISRHLESGKYYIGKGKTSLVNAGHYKGSGSLMLRMLKKHPKDEWVTTVIETFETAEQAYNLEGQLVTEEVVADPMSLNLKTGGVGNCRHSAETKLKMSASHQNRKPMSDENRQKLAIRNASRSGWSHSPEARAKMSEKKKATNQLRRESLC